MTFLVGFVFGEMKSYMSDAPAAPLGAASLQILYFPASTWLFI